MDLCFLQDFGEEKRSEAKNQKENCILGHAGCLLIDIIGHVEFYPKRKIPEDVGGPGKQLAIFPVCSTTGGRS